MPPPRLSYYRMPPAEMDKDGGNNKNDAKMTRKKRPSSAPGGRRVVVNASNQLYSSPQHKREPVKPDPLPETAALPPTKKIEFDKRIHTFDYRSGRRILITQAEFLAEEQRRNFDTLKGGVVTPDDDYMMCA